MDDNMAWSIAYGAGPTPEDVKNMRILNADFLDELIKRRQAGGFFAPLYEKSWISAGWTDRNFLQISIYVGDNYKSICASPMQYNGFLPWGEKFNNFLFKKTFELLDSVIQLEIE